MWEGGQKYVQRLSQEADDVVAAADYLARQPFVDPHRIAVMGWSFGGIVTVLAASRHDFRAAIDQASGALSWKGSPELQAMLKDAATKVRTPLLSMVAVNDATTESVKTIDHAVPPHIPHKLILYPAFHMPSPPPNIAEGHMIFFAGIQIWKDDALSWLQQYDGAGPPPEAP
jgi:dienelactone hydrolase